MKNKRQSMRVREAIAQEAARIMSQEMVRDFHQAKLKACARLGYSGKVAMPANEEVQQALQSYIQVFKSDEQYKNLRKLRHVALEAMQFLSDFHPHLVGAVLSGTADSRAAVHLHVFADPEESILQFLVDKKIPYDTSCRHVSYGGGRQVEVTVCEFTAGGVPIELSVFGVMGLREAPKSSVDGKAMRRAAYPEVEAMVNQAH